MPKLPATTGREFVRFLESLGFSAVRQRGSHVRMRHPDGRVTTVPVHARKGLPTGLLRAIIRHDLEMEREEFMAAWERFMGRGK